MISHLAENTEMPTPAVSVVIVNYNGLGFLRPCLQSVNQALHDISHEIIVVDNASMDASCALLEAEFPDIRLIKSAVNTGFTGGNNLGTKYAQAPLLLLLNNDTECKTDLKALLKCCDDPSVGVAGCLLRYGDGRLQTSVGFDHTPARIVLSWTGLSRFFKGATLFSRVQQDQKFYAERHDNLAWVSGACLLTRTEIWRRLNGLDEHFFMYCEDVDYCYRVKSLGLKVVFDPQSEVTHYEGSGKAWIGEMALLRTSRSYLIYVEKHFGKLARSFVGIALGNLFLLRSLSYAVSWVVSSRNIVITQKLRAYARAGAYLVIRGIGLQSHVTKI
jgi:hypothetical protein